MNRGEALGLGMLACAASILTYYVILYFFVFCILSNLLKFSSII